MLFRPRLGQLPSLRLREPVHADPIVFPGAVERAEDRLFARVADD